jgi:hypothetical protein
MRQHGASQRVDQRVDILTQHQLAPLCRIDHPPRWSGAIGSSPAHQAQRAHDVAIASNASLSVLASPCQAKSSSSSVRPTPVRIHDHRSGPCVARDVTGRHTAAPIWVSESGNEKSGAPVFGDQKCDRSTTVASAPLPTVRTVTQTPPRQLQAKMTHPSPSAC